MNDYIGALLADDNIQHLVENPNENGKDGNDPDLIVVHAMAEYIKTKDGNKRADIFLEEYGLSAHCLIFPNGHVMVCRYPDQVAWHAKGFNLKSLGVEFLLPGVHDYGSFQEGIREDWVTSAAWRSGVALVHQWVRMFGIDDIQRHSDLSPERKADPGTGFDWSKFINEVNHG